MKIEKGLVYWYQVSMHLDVNGDGIRQATSIRLPCKCLESGENSSTIQCLNPSSGELEYLDVENQNLFDEPCKSQFLNAGKTDDLTCRQIANEKFKEVMNTEQDNAFAWHVWKRAFDCANYSLPKLNAGEVKLPTDIEIEIKENIVSDMLGLLSKRYDDEEAGIHFKQRMKHYAAQLEIIKQKGK